MAAQPFLAEGWARLSLLAAVPLTFLVFYLARLLSDWLHRPRVRAGAATPPEFALPPALVCLLVEGANRAPRTMPATLLDLAARGHIKLSQPGADPLETTVEVRDNVDAETPTPYETSVLRWVRDAKQPTLATLAQWRRADVAGRLRRLEDQVIKDAVDRKLVKGGDYRTGLALVLTIVSCVFGVAIPAMGVQALGEALGLDQAAGPAGGTAVQILLALALIAVMVVATAAFAVGFVALFGRRAERYHLTRDGRRATAYWLGVRRWLRGFDAFGDLPPAAVSVWGPYLGYGVALDVAPTAAAAIGLDHARPSAVGYRHDGRFRAVRVRYPRRLRGAPSWPRLVAAAAVLAAGAEAWRRWGTDVDATVERLPTPTALALAGGAAVIVGWLLYCALRAAVDLLHPVQVTGTVVSRIQLRSVGRNDLNPILRSPADRRPLFTPAYLLIVHDGRAVTTRAWRANPRVGSRAAPGTVVRMRAQRWSRHVTSIDDRSPPPSARHARADGCYGS